VRANILKENAEQENKVAIMRSYINASVAEKKIRGIDVTPIDKYLQGIEYRNSRPPEQQALIKDWMILDAAGIKQEKGWHIDGRTVPNEDGTYSYAKINQMTGDVKWEKIPGSSWKEHKKGAALDVEKAKAVYWPHDPEAPQHVNNARALFFAGIDGEQDPNKQRYMLNTVMPDFKDRAMEHSGEVDAVDKDGKKIKKPLSNKEMRKWMEEAMKGYGGTPAAAGGKAGQADKKEENKGGWADLRDQALKKQESAPPAPPAPGVAEAYDNSDIEKMNFTPEMKAYLISEREKFAKGKAEREAKAAAAEEKMAAARKEALARRKKVREGLYGVVNRPPAE
jgi:hypothetical protein